MCSTLIAAGFKQSAIAPCLHSAPAVLGGVRDQAHRVGAVNWVRSNLESAVQVPMHSASGVRVQYLKVWEKVRCRGAGIAGRAWLARLLGLQGASSARLHALPGAVSFPYILRVPCPQDAFVTCPFSIAFSPTELLQGGQVGAQAVQGAAQSSPLQIACTCCCACCCRCAAPATACLLRHASRGRMQAVVASLCGSGRSARLLIANAAAHVMQSRDFFCLCRAATTRYGCEAPARTGGSLQPASPCL